MNAFRLPSYEVRGWSRRPLLPLVRVLKNNSSDYSIQSTAGQSLFLPTSRDAKYDAKAAIYAFFKCFGDALQGGTSIWEAVWDLHFLGSRLESKTRIPSRAFLRMLQQIAEANKTSLGPLLFIESQRSWLRG